MIRFLKLHGVDLGASSLPQVPRTPEGQAMGAIPGWSILADPSYMDVSGGSIRNRALSNDQMPKTWGVGSLAASTFPNGQEAFLFDNSSIYNVRSDKAGFNPTAWTAFTVVQPDNTNVTHRFFRSVEGDESAVGVNIGFSANGQNFIVWEGYQNSDQRINFSGGFSDRPGPSLLMVTFSTREGLRIYDNGEQVAAAPDDKRPLELSFGPGEVYVFSGSRGLYGMTGLLDIDLSWPEHAGYRRSIERFLLDKYGIA